LVAQNTKMALLLDTGSGDIVFCAHADSWQNFKSCGFFTHCCKPHLIAVWELVNRSCYEFIQSCRGVRWDRFYQISNCSITVLYAKKQQSSSSISIRCTQLCSLVAAFHWRFELTTDGTPNPLVHRASNNTDSRSTRFTLLLLVGSCLFEALPDCALWAFYTMGRHSSKMKSIKQNSKG